MDGLAVMFTHEIQECVLGQKTKNPDCAPTILVRLERDHKDHKKLVRQVGPL